MNKKSFLLALEQKLSTIDKNDCQEAISYYKEIIEDSVEAGKKERDVVKELGDLDDIVKKIIENVEPKQGHKVNRKERVLVFALLTPFIATLFILIWSLIIVVYSLIFSLYAIAISLFVVTVATGIDAIINVFSAPLYSAFEVGIALFSMGLGILMIIGLNSLIKNTNRFISEKWEIIWNWFKRGLGSEA